METDLAGLRERQRDIQREALEVDRELQPSRDEAAKGPCTCEHEELMHDLNTKMCRYEQKDENGFVVARCACRTPVFPPEAHASYLRLQEQLRLLEKHEFDPILVKQCLVSVEGCEFTTYEQLLSEAPEELFDAIAQGINERTNLTDEERKNFARPTTSTEKERGPNANGPAEPASASASISVTG